MVKGGFLKPIGTTPQPKLLQIQDKSASRWKSDLGHDAENTYKPKSVAPPALLTVGFTTARRAIDEIKLGNGTSAPGETSDAR